MLILAWPFAWLENGTNLNQVDTLGIRRIAAVDLEPFLPK